MLCLHAFLNSKMLLFSNLTMGSYLLFFVCLFQELLSEASFQEALQESIPDIQAHEWVPLWLLRYSVIVKSRGIIKSKGYILQAKRRGS